MKLLNQELNTTPQQKELIAGMFTREELNDIYANRKTKQMSAADFQQYVKEYTSVPWETNKEEIKYKLLNC